MPNGASPRDTKRSADRTFSAGAILSLTPSQARRLSSATLPYLPAGTVSTLPIARRPPFSSAARSTPPTSDTAALESFGAISTSLLPRRFDRVWLDQVLLLTVIHPVQISRNEYVG